MNKCWYTTPGGFRAKQGTHFCHRCNSVLIIIDHKRYIDKKSPEAKYYDGGIMTGQMSPILLFGCEFIHKVFYCKECCKTIEFSTQLSLEKLDSMIGKTTKKYQKKGIDLKFIKNVVLSPYNKEFESAKVTVSHKNQIWGEINLPIHKNTSMEREEKLRITRWYFEKQINRLYEKNST